MIKETCGVCVPLTSAFEWGKGPFSCQFPSKNSHFCSGKWWFPDKNAYFWAWNGSKTIKRFEKVNFDSASCSNNFHWTSVVGRRCWIRHPVGRYQECVQSDTFLCHPNYKLWHEWHQSRDDWIIFSHVHLYLYHRLIVFEGSSDDDHV